MLSFYPEKGFELFTIKVQIIVDGESIGQFLLVPHSEQMYEIHMSALDKRYRGHAPEISKAALKYGFSSMSKLRKLVAMIPSHNKMAIRLAELSGMQKEGTLKDSFFYLDEMEDQEIYGIRRKDICQWPQ